MAQVFDAARLLSQCNGRGVLVFIDEIDALASQRTGNDRQDGPQARARPAATAPCYRGACRLAVTSASRKNALAVLGLLEHGWRMSVHTGLAGMHSAALCTATPRVTEHACRVLTELLMQLSAASCDDAPRVRAGSNEPRRGPGPGAPAPLRPLPAGWPQMWQ